MVGEEVPLIAVAMLWCGCRHGFRELLALLICSTFTTVLFPKPSAPFCRRHAGTGLLLGTALLPTIFAGEAGSVAAIFVAFRLTWWSGLAANALRASSCCWRPARPALCAALVAGSVLTFSVCVAAMNEALLLPALLVFVMCLLALQRAMPRSFTFGEAVLVAELCAVLFHFMLFSVIFEVTPLPVLESKLRKIVAIGLFSAVVISTANLLLARMLVVVARHLKSGREHRDAYHTALTLVLLVIMLQWMSRSIGQNSLYWLWEYITSHTATPLKFIMYYCAVLPPALALAPACQPGSRRRQVLVRKYFHLLALVMFVPTILINVRFMVLAFAVALAIFMVLESLRIAEMPSIAAFMNPFMQVYVDDRDEGTAVLTHIYLLLGCALPVFFNYFVLRGIFSANALLIALSGVSVTGLGDAMASYCGVTFGKHRWHGTKKTMEGTAGMIVAVVAFQIGCLWSVGFQNLSIASWGKLVLADVLVALLEAKTDQIDNLFLPLYHVALLQMV